MQVYFGQTNNINRQGEGYFYYRMVEWYKNIVDFKISWEKTALQKSCHSSARKNVIHIYIYIYNVDIVRHYLLELISIAMLDLQSDKSD